MARIVDYPRAGKSGVRRFVPGWRLVLGLAALVAAFGVLAFALLYRSVAVPDPNKLVTANASIAYYADGRTELGRFGEVNRESVPITDMPKDLQNAVIAAEDRSFRTNSGVSLRDLAFTTGLTICPSSSYYMD